jgi:hypothetical protein
MRDLVRERTPSAINSQIDRETLEVLECFRSATPEDVELRIRRLEREWDLDRAADVAGGALAAIGLLLGIRRPRWMTLPLAVQALLLLKASPVRVDPVTLALRVIGFRSTKEIEREKFALKVLRGDYHRFEVDPTAKGALTSAQGEVGIESRYEDISSTGPVRTSHGIEQYPIGSLPQPSRIPPEQEPLGEDLKPDDLPTVSGPSGAMPGDRV